MKTFELSYMSSGLSLTEEEREEGIILKIDKGAFRDGTFVVRMQLCTEEERNASEVDNRSTIPGHPNCRVGDCIDCHVTSCAIYQGYEEMP